MKKRLPSISMDVSDEVLAKLFVDSGDVSAFELLVKRHTPGIRKVLYAVFNGNRDDMLDAEQEILMALYRSLNRFSYKSTFRTWLYTFTRNRAIDHLRTIKRQKRIADKVAAESTERIVDPESRAIDSLEDQRAMIALKSLKEEQRTLIVMKDIEELSIAEIGAITGLAVGTVKSRLHRARMRVAKIMEES